ncbi:TPA: TIGR03747 family integrating conjugative element membrane protein [Klebsiella pneumoniae]|uniref:TIGR03747 family integrating conjugative element membrane protein n=1 Tax=Salmonella enterica TaxID=28901 RepID=A0A7H0RWW1_SALER|nr:MULTISPECIES: TIGR03747 family integrating conjugative element membrane protein [Enterobacteriaceae]ECA5023879.1 TIGR03747 family integrating conjugative element membrane protein [Salmonella enterica subsp. enterica serovar Ohio]ECE8812352.1 TIGR03747 family integrating conjugative element membrane protein [Salmonella enterica subsp. enterica serovar Virchow]MDZ1372659.1 TIGR03747 family integrating conjugative element membrane protein [Klebsiella pneumoniae]HAT7495853.1 TIGR03747 family int
MPQQDSENGQRSATPRQRQSGPIGLLLWDFPMGLIGVLLGSLLVSLLIEYVCIALLWPEEGAAHSYQVMVAESHWLSGGYTRSLLMAAPVETVSRWVHVAWQWLFVDSGFSGWLQSFKSLSEKGSGLIPALNGVGATLVNWLGVYLQATVWVTLIFFIRVMILFLSLPLFALVVITGVVDGLVRRDLRRYGAGYESSFVYHHAKRFIKPALYGPCMLYLAWPTAVWPNLLLLPSALLVGAVLAITTATFKKYL